METRHAGMADTGALAEAESLCFPPEERASAEKLEKRVASCGDLVWLLEEDGELAAYTCGMASDTPDVFDEMYESPSLHDPDGAWHVILTFGVMPRFRRQGYGSMLMRRVIDEAKARGRKGCVLCCKEDLLAFYTIFGYRDEGVTDKSVLGGAQWHQARLTF